MKGGLKFNSTIKDLIKEGSRKAKIKLSLILQIQMCLHLKQSKMYDNGIKFIGLDSLTYTSTQASKIFIPSNCHCLQIDGW